MSLQPGARLSAYEILGLIGTGGMGRSGHDHVDRRDGLCRMGAHASDTAAGGAFHCDPVRCHRPHMVKAGLTPSEVITAATRNSAQILGLDQLGMVAPGKHADFLVLDANPLNNIANTRRISGVYLRGGVVDRAALRTQLNGGSAAATRPPTTH